MTRDKLALVHVAKKQLGLDEDTYRTVLDRAAGVRSSKALDLDGFKAVMAELERLGFKSDSAAAGFGDRLGMATRGQVATIRKLWRSSAYGESGEKGLRTWLETKFKLAHLRFVDARDAPRIITALKRMVGEAERGGGQGDTPSPAA